MRLLLAALAIAAITSTASAPAQADQYRWCAEYGPGNGGVNCGFVTLAQCRAAISGNGGSCRPNAYYTGPGRYRH
jgi:hypothetical protein